MSQRPISYEGLDKASKGRALSPIIMINNTFMLIVFFTQIYEAQANKRSRKGGSTFQVMVGMLVVRYVYEY